MKQVERDGKEEEERKQKTEEATHSQIRRKNGAIRSKRIKKMPYASKTAQKETFSEKALLALYLNIFIGQGSTSMFRPRHLAEQKLPNQQGWPFRVAWEM